VCLAIAYLLGEEEQYRYTKSFRKFDERSYMQIKEALAIRVAVDPVLREQMDEMFGAEVIGEFIRRGKATLEIFSFFSRIFMYTYFTRILLCT
jgi:hypothetical protein